MGGLVVGWRVSGGEGWGAEMKAGPGEQKWGVSTLTAEASPVKREGPPNESSRLGVPGGWRGLLGSVEESGFHPGSPQWDWGSLRWQKGPSLSC